MNKKISNKTKTPHAAKPGKTRNAAKRRIARSPVAKVPHDGLLYAAPALDKGIDILECLGAVDHEHGLSKAEIAQNLGRNISEVFRMIVTLERRGWVVVDRAERYHLSLRLFELSHHHHRVRTLSEAALPSMRRLAREARQSCHLSIAERGRIVLIAQVDAPGNINFSVRIGTAVSLFGTASGQVLLAFRSEEARAQLLGEYHLLSGVSDTHSDWREEVERVHARGYARAPSQQVQGVTNLGYPIWRRDGLIEAALVVPYLEVLGASRGPSQEIVCDMMAETAQEISLQLGFVPTTKISKNAART